jgi:bis(5'-nucleosidyl)-tetraphosphatase
LTSETFHQEESFGIIPLKEEGGNWHVFLIQHKHGRHWGFPKGHAEKGEAGVATAVRELKEETHLELVSYLQKEPLIEEYRFVHQGRRIFKRVYYYIAKVKGEVHLQEKEVQDGAWMLLGEARERITHLEGKKLLAQVETILLGKCG